METKEANLPIIDMRRTQTEGERGTVATEIVNAMKTVGFLILKNVEGLEPDRLLKACEWFFSQSLEKKYEITRKRFDPKKKNVYRGYFPTAAADPKNSSNKECFEMGCTVPADDPDLLAGNVLYENPQWPAEDGTVPFKEIVSKNYEVMRTVSLELVRLIALGLGFEEHCMDEMFVKKPLSTHRLIHYPSRTGEIPASAISEDGKVLVTDVHHDTSVLTILETFHYTGLEIQSESGEWLTVTPQPGTLIVNIGDLLVKFCGGKLKATKHRVIDIGCDRYSVPFFMEPTFHTDINRSPLLPKTPEGTPKHKYGHWMIETEIEKQFYEYLGLENEFNWKEL